ncbi:hypothetical protein [Thermoleptolyngbya sp. M55_K2018_002]|uniref:hypothetical protein n=1 Tax=Thermoleptolyngbya sp. M55_K2018_002 TaxID=2747808 RepID=UPI0019F7A2D5|nr:hypothetical protein [Thermoleptolyngbya sp. M55_K2018_002]HIK41502.1 hypothetical protein [Thermoleptolyngbya sp. M55_K2018_002]
MSSYHDAIPKDRYFYISSGKILKSILKHSYFSGDMALKKYAMPGEIEGMDTMLRIILIRHEIEHIPDMQVCPHPPAPSPKEGEGEPDWKSLSSFGREI